MSTPSLPSNCTLKIIEECLEKISEIQPVLYFDAFDLLFTLMDHEEIRNSEWMKVKSDYHNQQKSANILGKFLMHPQWHSSSRKFVLYPMESNNSSDDISRTEFRIKQKQGDNNSNSPNLKNDNNETFNQKKSQQSQHTSKDSISFLPFVRSAIRREFSTFRSLFDRVLRVFPSITELIYDADDPIEDSQMDRNSWPHLTQRTQKLLACVKVAVSSADDVYCLLSSQILKIKMDTSVGGVAETKESNNAIYYDFDSVEVIPDSQKDNEIEPQQQAPDFSNNNSAYKTIKDDFDEFGCLVTPISEWQSVPISTMDIPQRSKIVREIQALIPVESVKQSIHNVECVLGGNFSISSVVVFISHLRQCIHSLQNYVQLLGSFFIIPTNNNGNLNNEVQSTATSSNNSPKLLDQRQDAYLWISKQQKKRKSPPPPSSNSSTSAIQIESNQFERVDHQPVDQIAAENCFYPIRVKREKASPKKHKSSDSIKFVDLTSDGDDDDDKNIDKSEDDDDDCSILSVHSKESLKAPVNTPLLTSSNIAAPSPPPTLPTFPNLPNSSSIHDDDDDDGNMSLLRFSAAENEVFEQTNHDDENEKNGERDEENQENNGHVSDGCSLEDWSSRATQEINPSVSTQTQITIEISPDF